MKNSLIAKKGRNFMRDYSGNLRIIDIIWDGPKTIEEVQKAANKPYDYGLYQIYGTHTVFGPDSLLYIGIASDRKFSQRLSEHQKDWIIWEQSATTVYLGRLAAIPPLLKKHYDEWGKMIKRAEEMLIYYCSPPYNSMSIARLKENHPPTLIQNFKRFHRLPMVITNLEDDVKPWKAGLKAIEKSE